MERTTITERVIAEKLIEAGILPAVAEINLDEPEKDLWFFDETEEFTEEYNKIKEELQ